MNHKAYPKKGVIEYIAHLCVIERSRESTFSEEEEYAEGNYYIFPSEEDEEVGQSIDEPSSMMQDEPV